MFLWDHLKEAKTPRLCWNKNHLLLFCCWTPLLMSEGYLLLFQPFVSVVLLKQGVSVWGKKSQTNGYYPNGNSRTIQAIRTGKGANEDWWWWTWSDYYYCTTQTPKPIISRTLQGFLSLRKQNIYLNTNVWVLARRVQQTQKSNTACVRRYVNLYQSFLNLDIKKMFKSPIYKVLYLAVVHEHILSLKNLF